MNVDQVADLFAHWNDRSPRLLKYSQFKSLRFLVPILQQVIRQLPRSSHDHESTPRGRMQAISGAACRPQVQEAGEDLTSRLGLFG